MKAHPTMDTDRDDEADDWPRLISALADGEADGDACSRALRPAADEDGLLDRWHAYHLIGDVLRSEELAAAPAHDRSFLHELRNRLAAEPVAAPPAPATVPPTPAALRPRWALPLALAASVAVLATTMVVLRLSGSGGPSGPTLAGVQSVAERNPASAAVAQPSAQAEGVRSVVLRDAQLDRYLRAHREYGAAQPLSLPLGAVRGVETVSFER